MQHEKHCDLSIRLLLLPTSTVWFSLNVLIASDAVAISRVKKISDSSVKLLTPSLSRICYQTPVSTCKTASKTLLWVPNRLSKLLGVHFDFFLTWLANY